MNETNEINETDEITDKMVDAAMDKFWSYLVRDTDEVYRDMMREVIRAALYAGEFAREKIMMTSTEIEVIRAVIGALEVPRDRHGKLESKTGPTGKLRVHAMRMKVPLDACDVVDQATMVLQALIGDRPRSILDKIGA